MKRIFLLCIACCFLSALSAQSTRKIRELENKRKELHQQIAESETLLQSTKKDVKSQLENLALLTGQIEERRRYIHTIETDVNILAKEITTLQRQLTALQRDLKEKKKITSANILSILRGALNYPLEESCYKEHIRVHDISFMSSERVFENGEMTGLEIKYCKLATVPNSTLLIGDIIASGETLVNCLRYVIDYYRKQGAKLRNIVLFTIGGTQGVEILEKLTQEIRVYWPGFEGFVTVYYEGIFSCYEEGNKGVSGINRALIDFYWKGGIIAPAFRRETLSMQNPLFEKCTIYDGGARRYEIHEHIEEVLEFWNGILERADSIDKQALLEEKLGHPLPISYEDWLKDCHYEKLDKKTTRWLYQQERGFVEGMRDVSLKEIARQRIDEFTTTLRKYIL